MSCVEILVGVFVIVLLISIISPCVYYKKDLEKFGNTMYSSWKKDLTNMGDIGKPPGYLKLTDNKNCDTSKNIMIQSNVAYRPVRYSKGCMEVVKAWP